MNCEWSDQQHIFVNEDAQQYIYDGTAKAFAIIGAPNNFNDIRVSYFVDGSWTETAPSDAGVYDVKLKRSAKGNYCDFDLTIEKALEICPVLDKVNNIAIEEGSKGEYYVGKAENLPAHIDGMQLKHIAGTDEEGNSDDYSAVLVYRDLNEDGECSDGEALTYSTDYTLQSGSVIVMLSKDYINTLEVGEYQITVEVSCKSGRTYQFMVPITILEALKPVPPTGEIQWRSSVLPIAALSLAAVISDCVVLKKKRNQQ